MHFITVTDAFQRANSADPRQRVPLIQRAQIYSNWIKIRYSTGRVSQTCDIICVQSLNQWYSNGEASKNNEPDISSFFESRQGTTFQSSVRKTWGDSTKKSSHHLPGTGDVEYIVWPRLFGRGSFYGDITWIIHDLLLGHGLHLTVLIFFDLLKVLVADEVDFLTRCGRSKWGKR